MPQVIYKGILHLDADCELVRERSGAREVKSHIPKGTIECVCMVLARNIESEIRVGEATRGVFERLEDEVKAGEVSSQSLFQALVTCHLNPDSLEDAHFGKVFAQAEGMLKESGSEAVKREVVRAAFLGHFKPHALHRVSEVAYSAANRLNMLSAYEMKHKLREDWIAAWYEDGASAARKAVLGGSAAWSSGKPAGDYTNRPEQDGLATQAVWAGIVETFEACVNMMMHLLDDQPERVVLLKDWTRFAGTMGTTALWDMVMTNERVVVGDVLAVKMPEWAAEYLEASHKPERRVGVENTHLLTLERPGENWKASVETMLVLWTEAGGSFHFDLNSYGSRETRDGNAEHWTAWASAQALEEN